MLASASIAEDARRPWNGRKRNYRREHTILLQKESLPPEPEPEPEACDRLQARSPRRAVLRAQQSIVLDLDETLLSVQLMGEEEGCDRTPDFEFGETELLCAPPEGRLECTVDAFSYTLCSCSGGSMQQQS